MHDHAPPFTLDELDSAIADLSADHGPTRLLPMLNHLRFLMTQPQESRRMVFWHQLKAELERYVHGGRGTEAEVYRRILALMAGLNHAEAASVETPCAFDYQRVFNWATTPQRQRADDAFPVSSVENHVACLIEDLMVNLRPPHSAHVHSTQIRRARSPAAEPVTRSADELHAILRAAIHELHVAYEERKAAHAAYTASEEQVRRLRERVGAARRAIIEACTPPECAEDWKDCW